MKTKNSVLFAYSLNEVKIAVQYIKTYANEKIHLLVPTLEGQLYLIEKGIKHDEYNQFEFNNHDYYSTTLEKIFKRVRFIKFYIRKKLLNIKTYNISLVDIYQNLFEAEFADVIFAKHIFDQIEKLWKPEKYIFFDNITVHLTGWNANYFSIAAIIKEYYVSRNRLININIQKKTNINHFFINTIKKVIILANDIRIKIINYFIFDKNKLNIKNKYDFLLFSSGLNLYYYNKFFRKKKTKNNFCYLIVSDKQTMKNEVLLSKAGISYTPLGLFENKRNRKSCNNELKNINDLIDNLRKKNCNQIFPNNILYPTKKALFDKLVIIFQHYSRRFIKHISLIDEIFKNNSFKLIITTHDPGPSALPFVYFAKMKNIPSLVLLHGLHQSTHGTNYESDYKAVWGKTLIYWYKKFFNKNPKKIFNIGFPYLDNYFKKNKFLIKYEKLRFHNPINIGILITFYAPTVGGDAKFFIELFKAAIVGKNKYIFNIRFHAGNSSIDVKKLKDIFGMQINLCNSVSLDEFVKANDIILTHDTTALIWPMIYRKPLFFTPPWWGKGHIPVDLYKAAWIPKNAEDLFNKIDNLNNENYNKLLHNQKIFLENVVGSIEGDSTEKLEKLINKLIKK